ncbi:MAG: hypothetical protein WD717_06450 [Nitrosarchaeum sp.]
MGKMLGHNGFHFGKYGLWDPRTDMMMFDQDEIKNNTLDLLDPKTSITNAHERSHRSFYSSRTILDIASTSFYYNLYIMNKELRTEDFTYWIHKMSYNLARTRKLIIELDPMLDAYFALVLYHDIKDKTDEDNFFRILEDNLHDEKSIKFFDALVWLYEAFDNRVTGRMTVIPQFVLFRSLDVGLYPFELKHNKQYFTDPTDVFFSLFDTLKAIHESNKNTALKLYEKILNYSYLPSNLESFNILSNIMNEIKNYDPNYKTMILQDYDNEILREHFHNNFHENFLPLDMIQMSDRQKIAQQIPVITAIKENNRVTMWTSNNISTEQFSVAHANIVLTHAQDCFMDGKDIECFYCKAGFCTEIKNRDFQKNIHAYVEEAKVLLPELIIKK